MSKSILQDYKGGECYLCSLLYDNDFPQQTEEHHIFYGGGNRKLSEHYGLKVKLCIAHHREGPEAVHRNKRNRELLCRIAQRKFEEKYPDKNFREIFGKNYL